MYRGDNAKIYYNDNKLIGVTDEYGFLEIPSELEIDSVKIKRPIGLASRFIVDKRKFNQMFIMIYDYSLEPCSNFYYESSLLVRKRKLTLVSKNKFDSNKITLQKVDSLR
jgi:hypothetical protein